MKQNSQIESVGKKKIADNCAFLGAHHSSSFNWYLIVLSNIQMFQIKYAFIANNLFEVKIYDVIVSKLSLAYVILKSLPNDIQWIIWSAQR